jgi:hypothetical protein
VQLDRTFAADFSDDAGHRRGPRPRGDDGGIAGVDPLQRGGEAVGITLAPDLAVGHDVDAGALHVADRNDGGVILGLLQIGFRNPPHLGHAGARHRFGQNRTVDQPVGLRVASDHGGRQQMTRQWQRSYSRRHQRCSCYGRYGYSTKAWQSSSGNIARRMFLAVRSGHIVVIAAGPAGPRPRDFPAPVIP